MQANVNSSTAPRVIKKWRVRHYRDNFLTVVVIFDGKHEMWYSVNITGASPAYVEAVVEELNIRVNDMMYNLGRIAV